MVEFRGKVPDESAFVEPGYERKVSADVKGFFHRKVSIVKRDVSGLSEKPVDQSISADELEAAGGRVVDRIAASALAKTMGEVKKKIAEKIQTTSEEVGFTDSLQQIGRSVAALTKTIAQRIDILYQRVVPPSELDQDDENFDEKVKIGSPKTQESQERQKLVCEHWVRGELYGKEEATPIPTADVARESLRLREISLHTKLDSLTVQISKMENGDEKNFLIQQQTKLQRTWGVVKAAQKAIPDEASQFVSSGDVRAMFREGKGNEVLMTQIPNMYRQTVYDKDGNKLTTFIRGAALHGWELGLTSLDELRKAESAETLPKVQKRMEVLEKKLTHGSPLHRLLEYVHLKGPKTLTPQQKSAIDTTIELFTDPAAAVARREAELEQQMLLLLQSQIEENAANIQKDQEVVVLGQISLLNPSKNLLEGTGFARVEANEILDTRDALEMFHDKKIVFDPKATAPYIDADGIVYMPRPKNLSEGVSSVTTKTCFFNVAVQAYKKKDLGLQQEIDRKSFARAVELIESRINEGRIGKTPAERNELRALYTNCRTKLAAGESSFEIAADLARLFRLAGFMSSYNCMSGKDRTGELSSQQASDALQDHVEETLGRADPKKTAIVKRELGSRDFDPNGISPQIVEVNTKTRWLKISPFAKIGGPTTLTRSVQRAIGAIGSVLAKAPD